MGFYAKDLHKSFWFREPGPHKIYCNIHQKMIADVFVVPNRYHTTTDDKGSFRLGSVPEGTYTVGVWHILGGTEEKTVVLNQDPVRLDFTLVSQKIIKSLDEHPDKFGNDYRQENANETKRY